MSDEPDLAPLRLLPREEWTVHPLDDEHLAVTMHTRMGARHRQRWSIFDFPNDFIGIEDLKRCGVYLVYVAAIRKLKGVAGV